MLAHSRWCLFLSCGSQMLSQRTWKRGKESHRRCFTFFLSKLLAVLLLPSSHTWLKLAGSLRHLFLVKGGKKKIKTPLSSPWLFFFLLLLFQIIPLLVNRGKKTLSCTRTVCLQCSPELSGWSDRSLSCVYLACVWSGVHLPYRYAVYRRRDADLCRDRASSHM